MREDLAKELEKIGLSENEAKVYLAGLSLGPSTAQMIAAKATVSRPTTYIMIESLIKRGLMSSFQKGKKRFFSSEKPERLGSLMEQELENLKNKRNIFASILPALIGATSRDGNTPKVRVFEDLNGLTQLQEDLIRVAGKTKKIFTMAAVDDARDYVSTKSMVPLWKRINEHKIEVKSIYTKTGVTQEHDTALWQSRRLSKEQFPFHGELVIYGDRCSFVSYDNKICAFLIEDSSINSLMKTLFDLAWEASEKFSI